jgi:FkbM family methyltransferase
MRTLAEVLSGATSRLHQLMSSAPRFEPDEDGRYGWIQNYGIRTILDIGADQGEVALELHRILPEAALYAFEPLPDRFRRLQKRLSGLPRHQCLALALASAPGTLTMQRNEFSPSSSLLELTEAHRSAFPFAAHTSSVEVKVETLDRATSNLLLEPPILVKVDVQGYEDQVLAGASRVLRTTKVLIVELSFVELYAGQPLFGEMCDRLRGMGFTYEGAWDQLRDPRDGRILQQDAIFINQQTS